MKIKHKGNGEDVAITVETIDMLRKKVLPYAKKGMKFRTVDVFWTRMSKFSSGSSSPSTIERSSGNEENDAGMLKCARPPDELIGPIWRLCHMGILLQSFKDSTEEDFGLTVAIYLNTDGIHMKHFYGFDSQDEVVTELRKDYGTVISAGVKRDIDVELKALPDFVEGFKTAAYSVAAFNCQSFTNVLYHKFTQQYLHNNLKKRWTSPKDAFGSRLNDVEQKVEVMKWASVAFFNGTFGTC